MTSLHLRAWQAHMGYTYDSAAKALGVGRRTYAEWVAGDRGIDLRTALACAALAASLQPWPDATCERTYDAVRKEEK